jgi:glycerol-3-phosphate dehydrogenase (NAD(P)+)
VLGTTSWSVTLAWLLARNAHSVRLLCRTADEAATIATSRRAARMPAVELPANVVPQADPVSGFSGAEALIIAVPSATLRENARRVRDALAPDTLVVHAIKGIERGSGKRMSELLLDELPRLDPSRVCALSGPNLAPEIARGLPAATVVACADAAGASRARDLLHMPAFRVYTSRDVTGVELAGALKNVVALAAGMADGLGYGDNAKAGIITRALAEITRLGVAAGAEPSTFAGLAGIGDTVATCYSPLSRNRRAGEALARGATREELLAGARDVIEGFGATDAACTLAKRLGVDMPIAAALRELVYEGAEPQTLVRRLLEREPKEEGG